MPPPLPVPSKAAIHALRGIALGTSCAIGVIVEDRRRRISTLRTALSNKEKLRSARQYHGMTDPAALHLDEAVFSEDDLHWNQLDDRPRAHNDYSVLEVPQRRTSRSSISLHANLAEYSELQDTSTSSLSPTTQTQNPSPLSVQRDVVPPTDKPRQSTTIPQARIDVPAIIARGTGRLSGAATQTADSRRGGSPVKKINGILNSRDEERLDRALKAFFTACQSYYSFQHFDDEWIDISIRLSKACQAKDRWKDASEVLATTVAAGPLDESQFFAHEPIPIIQFHLRQKDNEHHSLPESTAIATHIFLAKFKDKPQTPVAEVENIGKQLVSRNLLSDQVSIIDDIYSRVVCLLDDPASFTGYVTRKLHYYGDHRNAINYFLLHYSKTSPDEDCYNSTVHCVITSIEHLGGLESVRVLRALAQMNRPEDGRVRSRWIFRLLQACYRRNGNYGETKAVFDEALSLGLFQYTHHPQAIYRAMVEISIKAGEDDMARSYYQTLLEKYPEMASDVALKGFIATAVAKTGDWDAVFDIFSEMKSSREGQESQYDDAFVMVLKVYVDSHPVVEARGFVRKYMSVLGVRMHPYIATLIANKYGECHDMTGFMSWLRHCIDSGLTLNPGLCNSFLHSCHNKWKLPYGNLQYIYDQLQQLGPDATDHVTRRIMSQAAAFNGRKHVKRFKIKITRVTHSRVGAINKLAWTGKTTNKRDVYEAMNQELQISHYMAAISIYKQALKFGMPPCRHCLRLAVLASVKHSNSGEAAMTLIREAFEQGEDVSSAVSAFIKFQLDNTRARPGEMLLYMRNLVSQFEALHIVIDHSVLTHMALICVKLGHQERAIALCTLAMNRCGAKNLCFSRRSILALLMAYAQLQDVEGMRKLIDDVLASDYSTERTIVLYMKSVRRMVKKYKPNAAFNSIVDILNKALAMIVERRAENMVAGKTIAQETLQIMQNALADMQEKNATETSQGGVEHEGQQHQHSRKDYDPSRLIVAGA
ncbi:hypothetical protein M426DRAFT_319124 [Hypoxylon sp. CI-4A]|nr:hypothetical protein M426DRAFT_319124 [Hypoxylon sp. CI-4A]